MKCNLERLDYLYDETKKKIEEIEKSEKNSNQEYHQCSICDFIRMFISLIFAIGLIAVEFTWIYNSPKESKYVVKINLNDTSDQSNEEDSTLRFLNEYLNNNSYNNNNILFRYLDDLNDNHDNNNNNLDDNNDDLNKTLNETDDSIVPFDSNVIFVGLLLVSVYFYFTFGIICRNFIYEGTLIGTKNTDTLSLLNFAVLINDYFMPLYLHNIQILSIFVGYETNISILEDGFLMPQFYVKDGEVEELYTHDRYLPYFFLVCIIIHFMAFTIEESAEKCVNYCSCCCSCCCCCCKKSSEKTEVHLGINDYSKYFKYSPVFCMFSINKKNNTNNNNNEVSSEQDAEYDD